MAVKSSGLTIHAASKQFGFHYSYEDNAQVEEAIDKFQEIKDSVLSIAAAENEAFMKIMGFDCDGASSSSSSEDDDNEPSMEKTGVSKNLDESTGDHDKESSLEKRDASKNLDESTATDHDTTIPHQFLYKEKVHNTPFINTHQLMDLLQVCELNWFQFAFVIEDQLSPITPEALAQLLLDFSGQIPFMGLTNEIESKIEYSRQAYLQQTRQRNHEEQAELGLIVSDNSSDEGQSNYAAIDNVFSKEGIEAIKKERQKIKRRARYALKKKIAEERLLRGRTSRKVGRVLAECPDIGEVIECFVKESGCGADKWRRTGVMTFDGNVRVNKKVTFERIREHLQYHYKKNLVMELLYNSVLREITGDCLPRGTKGLPRSQAEEFAKVSTSNTILTPSGLIFFIWVWKCYRKLMDPI